MDVLAMMAMMVVVILVLFFFSVEFVVVGYSFSFFKLQFILDTNYPVVIYLFMTRILMIMFYVV